MELARLHGRNHRHHGNYGVKLAAGEVTAYFKSASTLAKYKSISQNEESSFFSRQLCLNALQCCDLYDFHIHDLWHSGNTAVLRLSV